jgi:hypothetical protein
VKLKNYGGVAKNAKILKEIKNALGCDVNIEVFHPAKIVELRGKDITFYHALVFESIVMWGDGVES